MLNKDSIHIAIIASQGLDFFEDDPHFVLPLLADHVNRALSYTEGHQKKYRQKYLQLQQLPYRFIPARASDKVTIMRILESGPDVFRMAHYFKISEEDYLAARAKHQKVEKQGDELLEFYIRVYSESRAFKDFLLQHIPSVKSQPERLEGFIRKINEDCKGANLQAIVFDILELSKYVDVPDSNVLSKNSKKTRESSPKICPKSDILELLVGLMASELPADIFMSIMIYMARLHLHVAAIWRELSIPKPKGRTTWTFPETAADRQATERTHSLSPSPTSGYGSPFPDHDVREAYRAEANGEAYLGHSAFI